MKTKLGLVLVTDDVINTKSPIGGVMLPIIRLIIKIIPKCIGSTPISTISGKKRGTTINIDATVSKMVPSKRKIIFIRKRIINFSVVASSVKNISFCGICSTIKTHEKGTAAEIKNPIIDVSSAQS